VTPQRWTAIEELFHRVAESAPGERSRLLEEAGSSDPELRCEVESLLLCQESAEEQLRAAIHAARVPGHYAEFQGTERFVVEKRLGAGGFGLVYQVYDRQQDAVVALKVLPQAAAGALYHFKREFRGLANTVHRNLVTLYELLSDNHKWFFTMELVEGVDFIQYVNHDDSPSALQQGRRFDAARLRPALRQLAEGVFALHHAGKLHRDLKPSNVLVDQRGRVVILDFGLVTEIAAEASSENGAIIGTPAYMSPEQAAGQLLSEASDWYSVGVMLYQALTGRAPIIALTRDVLALKQDADIPPPSVLTAGIPEDLDQLCRDLLRRDSGGRPSGREVLERLGGLESLAAGDAPGLTWTKPESHFVGREREMAELRRAFEIVQEGRASVAYVHGGSGTGKSALAAHFLEGLRNDDAAVVLAGRCYERESVPYKALDSLVDGLTQHLMGLPLSLLEALVPAGLSALKRLFPVLGRVEPFAQHRDTAILDLQDLRQQAFAAFRELLSRLARQKPVVLFIDDLQWGDADSAALLAGLFRPPSPPPLLWMACFRSEESETSPLLRTLLRSQSPWASEVHLVQLALKDLTWIEARDLACGLLGEERGAGGRAEAIAQEAKGNPFFIHELARSLGGSSGGSTASLDNIIRWRVSRLPEGARLLLEMVAVAAQPIALEVVKRAAKIRTEDESVLSILRSRYLVRTRSTENRIEIEAYHDRMREAVSQHLSPKELQAHHRALAIELEASGRGDPETLLTYFQGAGEPAKAARYAVTAAERASASLAFDRAARLYRTALDLGLDHSTETSRMREKLGDALTNAGRGGEAADAYLSAAEGMAGLEKLELQRRAAAQFLLSGRIAEGLNVARGVLEAVGVRIVKTGHRSLLRFLLWRARIRLRGLRFRERDATQISAMDRIRIDTCFSVNKGLSAMDSSWAHEFHARNLLYSLRSGDIYRIARALLTEAAVTACLGGRNRRRSEEVLATGTMLAERSANPHALGLAALDSGRCAFLRGEWAECGRLMQRAEATLRKHCTGVAWELATARYLGLVSSFFSGELKLLCERLPLLLQEAEARDDLYQGSDLMSRLSHVLHLAADQPEKAYEELASRSLARWPRQSYQHWCALRARVEIDFYCGRGRNAWEEVSQKWGPLRHAQFFGRMRYAKILTLHHRACAALACTEDFGVPTSECRNLLKTAQREAAIIEREKTPWGTGLASLLRAGIAARRGSAMEAIRLLAGAEAVLKSADMKLYAAAARHRRGELVGGDAGRALTDEADALMLRQEIRNPARMTAMLAPGVSLPASDSGEYRAYLI
jgi:hypothetical protein